MPKDMFGRWYNNPAPSIEGYEEEVTAIINSVADSVQEAIGGEELLKILNTPDIVKHYLVVEINKVIGPSAIPLDEIDSRSIAGILPGIIAARKEAIETSGE